MIIQFTIKNEPILLRADNLNYELCKLVTRKDRITGKQIQNWEPFKFFSSLDHALNKIIDLKVRASDARTLAELKATIEATRDEVCRMWSINKGGIA